MTEGGRIVKVHRARGLHAVLLIQNDFLVHARWPPRLHGEKIARSQIISTATV